MMDILTFDIEDWFHILDNESTKTENEWCKYDERIFSSVERILDLLQRKRLKATFFCLGWVARKYPKIVKNIDALDKQLKQKFSGWKDRRFIVFHPSWGYFAQAYGLKMTAIEIQGKDPKPAQLQALIEHAREEGIRMVFVQPQFSTRSAKLIAREIGGNVAFADPLAGNWADNLLNVADQLKAGAK